MPSSGDTEAVTLDDGTKAVRLGSSKGVVGVVELHEADTQSVIALRTTHPVCRNHIRHVTRRVYEEFCGWCGAGRVETGQAVG